MLFTFHYLRSWDLQTDFLLRSFISYHALGWKVYSHLSSNQRNLRSLHTTFGDLGWVHAPLSPLPLAHLRTIDVCFNGTQHLAYFFEALCSRSTGETLERLALSIVDNDHQHETASEVAKTFERRITSFPKLKELSLLNLRRDLGDMFVLLSRHIRFEHLLRLNVASCDDSFLFFSDMGKYFKVQGSSLQHLWLRGPNDDLHYLDLLECCDQISSLHINLPEGLFTPILQESLIRLGPLLDTLALHEQALEGIDWRREQSLDATKLYQSCRNLRFLGHQLACSQFEMPRDQDFVSISKILVSTFILPLLCTPSIQDCINIIQENFHYLSNLRVVHFRYMPTRSHREEDPDNMPDQTQVTADIQHFVTTVFAYMDRSGICSRLRGIVFGMYWEPESPYGLPIEWGLEWPYTRHCFVRGYQTDAFNRKATVALPVPPHKIRELEPDCDLLDFDPECDWVGGIAGRLRSV